MWYNSLMGMFRYIQDFEAVGIKIPDERGGGFIPTNCHVMAMSNVVDWLYKDSIEYKMTGKKEFVHNWQAGEDKIRQTFFVNENDILAFLKWEKMRSCPREFQNKDDFCIHFLNIAKMGSLSFEGKGIVTADFTPYKTFERWVRENFWIDQQPTRYEYDSQAKKFTVLKPTSYQITIDNEMRESLREEAEREYN